MANPLFNQYGQNQNINQNFITRFQNFRNSFTGDPQRQVQQLLNSGKVTQEQYNNAVRMVNQLRGTLGRLF